MTPPLVPPELLDPVVAYFRPCRVILFGSHARGENGPDSDIDLLVVADDDTPPEKVTLRAGFEARRSYHAPADVIPVRRRFSNRTHAFRARFPAPPCWMASSFMTGPDPSRRWQRVEAWMRHAEEDARIAC